ncbi:unnamed protein product [Mytilus edulis]|uniref:Uncharacterized protein n=1 Tax=Mytilus edulis TaxID=6550 RepID=A0A8S3S763_MYTED|nr:unnamed protein product [Mytilus edulis]
MQERHYTGNLRSSYKIMLKLNSQWKLGSWSAYGSCSVTCGNGQYTRTRQCDNPAASGGGTDCAGDDSESSSCWTTTCYPNQLGNLDKNCGADNYGCVSGLVTCVTSAKRCDGTVDCSDGSDEDLTHAGCITTCSGADSMTMSVMLVASMWIFMKIFKQ